MVTPSSSLTLLATLERHYEELVNYVRHRFRGRGFARDVVHDVCLQVMERPPAEPVQIPLAMLRRMSTNRAIDWVRSDTTRTALAETMAEVPDAHAHGSDGAQALESQQHLLALVRIVEGLPPRARQVFLLSRIHDMPQQEIADALEISRNMVTQHLARALRTIEAEWEPVRAWRVTASNSYTAKETTPC